MVKRTKPDHTYSRFDAFARGMIWMGYLCGIPQEQIRMKVPKTDGSFPQLNAIEKVIRKKKESPEWRGESSGAGGRPCALSDGQN